MGDRATRGTVGDAPLVAVRRGLADVPADATLVGVVRNPSPGFAAAVDENRPSLGPPPALAEALARRREDLQMRGLCAEEAHNAAWAEVDVAARYADHLDRVEDVTDALAARRREGEDLVFVCDATTRRTRSHRTLVRERLDDD